MAAPDATHTPPAVYGQFGQALAYAERTLNGTLRDHLAERDVEPETWYALHLIATHQPGYARTALAHELEGNPALDAEKTDALLRRLESRGLINGGSSVVLTAAGEALHQSLREYIAGPTALLLGQLELSDVETTVRTLQAITALAVADTS